jgi:hypothetical protein
VIHPQCRREWEEFANAILIRSEMDESAFQLIERGERSFEDVRGAIDYAMSQQNVAVQQVLKDLLKCECDIINGSSQHQRRMGGARSAP